MPKELNMLPNERVDYEDFVYGTRTFTVDSLKNQLHRLITGNISGGAILDGFRVEVDLDSGTDRRIIVHNGVAIDRDGRLIVFESSTDFANNSQHTKTKSLPEAEKVYVMLEFELTQGAAVGDIDTRSFWDPTYVNAEIADNGGFSHPAPLGKEFPVKIATRLAQDWNIHVSTSGFEDKDDAGTSARSLRIPLAIIPINTVTHNIDTSGGTKGITLEKPETSIAITPEPGDVNLVCSNTRIFPNAGDIVIRDHKGNAVSYVSGVNTKTSFSYAKNDTDNCVLTLASNDGDDLNAADTDYTTSVKAGYTVELVSQVNAAFLASGSKWDCRPMLFAYSDPTTATADLSEGALKEPRNYKHERALALLSSVVTSSEEVVYGGTFLSSSDGEKKLAPHPVRSESEIKNLGEYFSVLGALVKEMKYGNDINLQYYNPNKEELLGTNGFYGPIITSYPTSESSSEPNDVPHENTTDRFYVQIDTRHPDLFAGDLGDRLIGCKLTIKTLSEAGQPVGASGVIDYVHQAIADTNSTRRTFLVDLDKQTFSDSPLWNANVIPTTGVGVSIETQDTTRQKQKYVDNREVGSLHEVYRARIDKKLNSWTPDLRTRLAANKIPTITVGDGIHSTGDYVGDRGLVEAARYVSWTNFSGIIHVKRGNYKLSRTLRLRSDVTLMGDGPGATHIDLIGDSYIDLSYGNKVGTQPDGSLAAPTYFAENITIKDISIKSASITEPDGSILGRSKVISNLGFPVKNLVIDNVILQGGGGTVVTDGEGSIVRGKAQYLIDLYTSGSAAGVSRNISIRNSTFNVEGNGIRLGGTRNVKVTDCVFQSESEVSSGSDQVKNPFTFVGMQAGIVITGTGYPGQPEPKVKYGAEHSSLSTGEISISGCTFAGKQTDLGLSLGYSIAHRGWIFISPRFRGGNVSVQSCEFIGDRFGQVQPAPTVKSMKSIKHQTGIAIHHAATYGGVLSVKDCTIQGYYKGIVVSGGDVNISGTTFIETKNGILTGSRQDYFGQITESIPANYGYVFAYGTLEDDSGDPDVGQKFLPVLDGPTTVSVTGCGFYGKAQTSLSSGIELETFEGKSLNSTSGYVHRLFVDGCSFHYMSRVVNAFMWSQDPSVAARSDENAIYELISLTNNTFDYIHHSVLVGMGGLGNTTGLPNRYRAIETLKISNNTFSNCGRGDWARLDPDEDEEFHKSLIKAEAYQVIIENNDFSDCGGIPPIVSGSVKQHHILEIYGFITGEINNNKFINCISTSDSETMTVMRIEINNQQDAQSIGTQRPKFKQGQFIRICDNSIWSTEPNVDDKAVQNCILFNQNQIAAETTQNAQDGTSYFGYKNRSGDFYPSLELRGNYFEPKNPNFVVLAVQDKISDYQKSDFPFGQDQMWMWTKAVVTGNTFVADIWNRTNFKDYSNNIKGTYFGYKDVDPGQNGEEDYTLPDLLTANYLGASKASATSMSATDFFGMLDLRMFANSNTEPVFAGAVGNRRVGAVISNNVFKAYGLANEPATDSDCHLTAGIRISRWPDKIEIKDNVLVNVPIQCRWTYKTYRDNSDTLYRGHAIDITGNHISIEQSGKLHSAIYVAPATGFLGKGLYVGAYTGDFPVGATGETKAGRMEVIVRGNKIHAPDGALDSSQIGGDGTNNSNWGLVRLTTLTSNNVLYPTDHAGAAQKDMPRMYDEHLSSAPSDLVDGSPNDIVVGQNHQGLASTGLVYHWILTDNVLENSIFYLDETANGQLLAEMTRFREGNDDKNIIGGTTWAGTHANIIVSNNFKTWKHTGALNGASLFGVSKVVGISRMELMYWSGTSYDMVKRTIAAGQWLSSSGSTISQVVTQLIVENNSGLAGQNQSVHAWSGGSLSVGSSGVLYVPG